MANASTSAHLLAAYVLEHALPTCFLWKLGLIFQKHLSFLRTVTSVVFISSLPIGNQLYNSEAAEYELLQKQELCNKRWKVLMTVSSVGMRSSTQILIACPLTGEIVTEWSAECCLWADLLQALSLQECCIVYGCYSLKKAVNSIEVLVVWQQGECLVNMWAVWLFWIYCWLIGCTVCAGWGGVR